jgi:Peptidase family M28
VDNLRVSRRSALAGALAAVPALRLETGAAQLGAPSVSGDIAAMLRDIDPDRIERTIRKLASFGTRSTLSSQDDPNRGIGAARDWLHGQFEEISRQSGGRLRVELQSFVQPAGSPRIPTDTVITNVVATLPGTQPASVGRTYVVSGHYDSIPTSPTDAVSDAPGANDDASGTAAVLEMARVMAGRSFDATIVFMAVAGEEQGLYGAAHFAAQAKLNGMDIHGMFTNDIIGSSTAEDGRREPFVVRLFAEGVPADDARLDLPRTRTLISLGGENDSPARELARFVKEVGERAVRNMTVRIIYRRDRFLRGGDHIPFLQNGYPAVRFTEPNEDFKHQHQNVRVQDGVQFGDLPEFVDFDYVARVARVNAAALATLARAPRAPAGARVVVRTLTNDTELTWTANPEPDLAGYEILIRETTEPLWDRVIRVGNVTTHTVAGVSKDNFLFGIRAVDQAGHRSPVSYPLP